MRVWYSKFKLNEINLKQPTGDKVKNSTEIKSLISQYTNKINFLYKEACSAQRAVYRAKSQEDIESADKKMYKIREVRDRYIRRKSELQFELIND